MLSEGSLLVKQPIYSLYRIEKELLGEKTHKNTSAKHTIAILVSAEGNS
jgi:hypothetical protein